jgi:hypothetical protein
VFSSPSLSNPQFSQEWDWNLRAKSVTRNPVFRTVDAVVSWNAKPNGRQGEYMVTWEVNKENFGVKGHVYTRNNSVTLNLNPEEVYRVQVCTLIHATLRMLVSVAIYYWYGPAFPR